MSCGCPSSSCIQDRCLEIASDVLSSRQRCLGLGLVLSLREVWGVSGVCVRVSSVLLVSFVRLRGASVCLDLMPDGVARLGRDDGVDLSRVVMSD